MHQHRLKKHAAMFRWLSRAKPNVVKTVIKAADKDLVDALCECGLNVLKGNVPLTQTQKKD